MKRTVVILVVVSALLGLVALGCGKKNTGESPAEGGVGKPETQKKMGEVYQKTSEKR